MFYHCPTRIYRTGEQRPFARWTFDREIRAVDQRELRGEFQKAMTGDVTAHVTLDASDERLAHMTIF